MSTELYTLPDGKYVLPITLWYNAVSQAVSERTFGDDTAEVRVKIAEGKVQVRKSSSQRGWYRHTPDGRECSAGHTFIYTTDELSAVCNALPYSWRV